MKTVIATKGGAEDIKNLLLVSAVMNLMSRFGPSAKLMDVLAALTGGPDKEAA
ncbi:hypothetical protein [Desulfarculus baarsii]